MKHLFWAITILTSSIIIAIGCMHIDCRVFIKTMVTDSVRADTVNRLLSKYTLYDSRRVDVISNPSSGDWKILQKELDK